MMSWTTGVTIALVLAVAAGGIVFLRRRRRQRGKRDSDGDFPDDIYTLW